MPEIKPPPLRNDCFALPPGVDWTPVDEAKALLKNALSAVVSSGIRVPVEDGFDRILSSNVDAIRSNPSGSNSAVDGFGFAGPIPGGTQIMKLCEGRAAAGVPFPDHVQSGQAVRILTGAILPDGVDTVVLEEDCTIESDRIAFNGPLKQWSNTREAGEDVREGRHGGAPKPEAAPCKSKTTRRRTSRYPMPEWSSWTRASCFAPSSARRLREWRSTPGDQHLWCSSLPDA